MLEKGGMQTSLIDTQTVRPSVATLERMAEGWATPKACDPGNRRTGEPGTGTLPPWVGRGRGGHVRPSAAASSRPTGDERARRHTQGGDGALTPAIHTERATFRRYPGPGDGAQREAHGVQPRD
eukprot:6094316-Pyramimonas_sp.AAC.1